MGRYLQNQSGTFYFRRKVPTEFKERIGVTEIKRSLGTGSRKLAKIRAAQLYLVSERLFEYAKMNPRQASKYIQNIAREMFSREIEKWEENFSLKSADVFCEETNTIESSRSFTRALMQSRLDAEKFSLQANKTSLSSLNIEPFLSSVGIESLHDDDNENQALKQILARLVQRGQIAAYETMLARLDGDYSFRPNDTLFSAVLDMKDRGEAEFFPERNKAEANEQPRSEQVRSKRPVQFSEIYETVIAQMIQTGQWKGQTVNQNRTTFVRFIEVAGDKPVSEYQKSDIAGFISLIRKLPRDWGRSIKSRDLSLQQIIKNGGGKVQETLAVNTLKRHHRALSKFFSHLLNEGVYEGRNPASGYKFERDSSKRNKRQEWSVANLEILFASPNWQGSKSKVHRSNAGSVITKDEKYWLPLLALYHGNRLEEFAQLRKSDIQSEADIPFFHIHGAGGRQIKNAQSERRVPVHPTIVKLGFLDYVDRIMTEPERSIFPALRPGGADTKYGFAFSKWFSRYRQEIGVFERGVDYHSFRHGFITQLLNKGVSKEIVEALVGHDSGESMTTSVYHKGFSLENLAEAIAKLEWPEVEKLFAEKAADN
ncbi:site-specific integrase [Sneathiella sp. HT1-7]|uniref:site-specific integrase n=1 Tax=Sneathiella sp. HT1-7 TaxID=2887192 RepID=UPI001D157DE4|nr:site-specific integrase [Sneathiella sp. HT1-7]MCC3303380.1 site-specific integrase [Sneathiella sp. HT1-7]